MEGVTPVFDRDERQLTESVNLKKPVIKEARKKLLHGVDWIRAGSRVLYSASGVEKLVAALGIQSAILEDLNKKKTPPAPGATLPTFEATVTRKFPNTRLVEAAIGEKKVRVRVRDSKNITVKMVLPVRETSAGSGLFELTRKAPRWPGRW